MLVFFTLLLVAALHNTIKFVLKDARGKNFHITYFYLIIYLIIAVRMSWLSLILNVVSNYHG